MVDKVDIWIFLIDLYFDEDYVCGYIGCVGFVGFEMLFGVIEWLIFMVCVDLEYEVECLCDVDFINFYLVVLWCSLDDNVV